MMRVRVVCGLSEVMATLVCRIWFRSVDLPTLGRPTKVTKPERISGPLASDGTGIEGVDAVHPHPADASPDDPLGGQLPTRHLDRLALGGHVAELGQQQPADRVPVALGELSTQQLVHLVERHARVDAVVATGQRLDHGVLDVELVDDLARAAPR